jgi:hypothetical protein
LTIKYDSLGNEKWTARYNPTNTASAAYDIAVDHIGNVYVTGCVSPLNNDYATVKYDSLGNERWARIYNGPDNGDDEVDALAIDDSGNVYLTGTSLSNVSSYDYATVKYDSSGEECWVRRYNGPYNDADLAQAITVDHDGNIYVTGASYDTCFHYIYWRNYATVKYNTVGDELWAARYHYTSYNDDYANDISVDDLGNVYVTGGSSEDYATVRYDSLGNQRWVGRYNGSSGRYDEAFAIAVDNAGNFYVTGQSAGTSSGYDYVTIKYSASTAIAENPTAPMENHSLCPTIFTGSLRLPKGKGYTLYDIAGRIVVLEETSPGIYFIARDGKIVQKIVKIR